MPFLNIITLKYLHLIEFLKIFLNVITDLRVLMIVKDLKTTLRVIYQNPQLFQQKILCKIKPSIITSTI